MEVLPLHPFLIKPNNHELEAMLGRTLSTKEDTPVEAAKELQASGSPQCSGVHGRVTGPCS